MARKKRSSSAAGGKSTDSATRRDFFQRRTLIKLGAVVFAGGTAVASLHAVDKNHRTLHDLSVIGNGSPAVVQIHDPTCPTCKRLKKIVTSAMDKVDGINYRLADITTSEGRSLQRKYNVPHVTLLYFDDKGRHRHTSEGLLTADDVAGRVRKYIQ